MFKALSNTRFYVHLIAVTVLVVISSTLWGATTGKIAGQVTDASTGDPIPGANVLIEGTSLGGAADADGQYFIINVPPGTYAVRAEVIGYETIVQSDVRVFINLTTTIDFAPQVEAVVGQEVEVIAIRPVVQPDISANVANIRSEEMEYVPVAGITEFINLQAGIEPGMRIRGAGTDALAFVVDGMSMRDGRSNRPFSAISYTAIQEVQIQTGGFNAEYGNVRSGLINVVTKDPPRDRYIADVLLRFAPPQPLSFDGLANDDDAYYWRPYMDPAVAFIGTDGKKDGKLVWDKYTQNQYPAFDGWNEIAEENILTAQQLQDVFKWHTRKELEIKDAEFDIDATLGGPVVPGGGLGGLRFLASYRSTQDPYFFPQARTVYTETTAQLKLMADLGPSMRLTISGLRGKQSGTANQASRTVEDEMPQLGGIPSYPWSSAGFTTTGEFSGINMLGESGGHLARSTIFGTDRYAVTDVTRNQFGAALTHTLNPRTFYKVSLNRMVSNYDSAPNSRRAELKNEFKNNGNAVDSLVGTGGTYYLDTAPFGWTSSGTSSPGSGLRLGGHWARARDASVVTLTTLKFDLTNQTNQFSQLKAGVEIILSDFDMDYGSDDSVIVHLDRSKQRWERKSTQAAFYVQDKLEFKGMIANLGLRLDSFSPGGDWWVYEDYEGVFAKLFFNRDEVLEKEAIERQFTLSPRVGVSFPITADSKLFFNYGHFRDVLAQRELYQIQTQWLGNIGNLGNPNHPLLKTVSYELGYEQSILDQYLLRLSGYYNDRSNQPGEVNFVSVDYEVNYNVTQPRNYGDTRGVEITLNKTRGQWFRGFVNYTFMTEKSGNFGFGQQRENAVEQDEYVRTSNEHYQNKPVSMPFARADLEFIAPATLGLLGDWRLNLLAGWRAGQVFTWDAGETIRGLANNVRQRNFTSLDIRLSKNFQTGLGRAQFFVDITNVLNLRHMYFNANARQPFEAFDDERPDWLDYMKSLHLPDDAFADIDKALVPYIFIPGDDRPGDFRKEDVLFVPIEIAASKGNLPTKDKMGTLEPDRRVLGWVDGTYYEYNKSTGSWDSPSSGLVDQVLDDRAYINMPNELYRTFLNPRKFLFGIRVWF